VTRPFHAVLTGAGEDRRLYAAAEWYWDSRARHRQLTDVEYSAKLREWLASVQFERIIADPSAAAFRVQLFSDGMRPIAAAGEVSDGIRLVSSLLATGRLLIHSSCTSLIDAMQSGVDARGVESLRCGIFTTREIWRNEIIPAGEPGTDA
jgi:hypothetical protein